METQFDREMLEEYSRWLYKEKKIGINYDFIDEFLEFYKTEFDRIRIIIEEDCDGINNFTEGWFLIQKKETLKEFDLIMFENEETAMITSIISRGKYKMKIKLESLDERMVIPSFKKGDKMRILTSIKQLTNDILK